MPHIDPPPQQIFREPPPKDEHEVYEQRNKMGKYEYYIYIALAVALFWAFIIGMWTQDTYIGVGAGVAIGIFCYAALRSLSNSNFGVCLFVVATVVITIVTIAAIYGIAVLAWEYW